MKWLIEHDATGKILGRLFYSEDEQLKTHPRRDHLIEITRAQHDSQPEKWSTGVDMATKKLKGVDPTGTNQ